MFVQIARTRNGERKGWTKLSVLAMAKSHVKESPPVKLVLQPIKVKAVFLNLKNNKDKNKNKANTTKKDQ